MEGVRSVEIRVACFGLNHTSLREQRGVDVRGEQSLNSRQISFGKTGVRRLHRGRCRVGDAGGATLIDFTMTKGV
jgi:hypothetical protein